nr:ribonuclease H-like domain-containing protein [Tanacetum cinerariifolium]
MIETSSINNVGAEAVPFLVDVYRMSGWQVYIGSYTFFYSTSECGSIIVTSMDNVNVPIVSSSELCVADSGPATNPLTCHMASSGHPNGPPVGYCKRTQLAIETQCAHQLDSGSLGGSDLQSPFSSVGFTEAVEPSIGKIGTGCFPSYNCSTAAAIPNNNGGVANNSSLGGHMSEPNVQDFMTSRVLLRCDSTGDLYPVTTPSLIPHVLLVSQHTWHQCLGHPRREVRHHLVSNNFISCNKKKIPVLCHACQLGKHVRLSFVRSNIVVTSCFDIIHSDFVRDNNCTIEFDAFGFSIKDFMMSRVLLRCDRTGDLYPITAPSPIPHVFLVSQHAWHQRLRHPGREVLHHLVSNNFISCNKEKPLVLCHACQLGKHVRLPFVSSNTIVTSCFDIIHSDSNNFKMDALMMKHHKMIELIMREPPWREPPPRVVVHG